MILIGLLPQGVEVYVRIEREFERDVRRIGVGPFSQPDDAELSL